MSSILCDSFVWRSPLPSLHTDTDKESSLDIHDSVIWKFVYLFRFEKSIWDTYVDDLIIPETLPEIRAGTQIQNRAHFPYTCQPDSLLGYEVLCMMVSLNVALVAYRETFHGTMTKVECSFYCYLIFQCHQHIRTRNQ